ncbi:MAG: type II toxin-antitoxin system VapC family toxin [Sphingomonadales bacterium]
MSGFLLDTHTFLWWVDGGAKLKGSTRELIASPSNMLYLSIASAWEISIKEAIGKLSFNTQFRDALEINEFALLPIEIQHVERTKTLPLVHRDPFDRMLVAQALVEDLTLITRDPSLARYGVRTEPA